MIKVRHPLATATVLALLAGAFSWIAWIDMQRKSHTFEYYIWKSITVADQDIPARTILNLDLLQQRRIPAQFFLRSMVPAEEAQHIIGKKVMVSLRRGDPILWSHFEYTRGFEKLSATVETRFRAVTIPIDEIESVGGWVRPNDHVDVIFTYRNPKTREMETFTLIQDVVVIATGKIIGATNTRFVPAADRQYHAVTLSLLPEEVELATLAMKMGTLTLALRSPEDHWLASERSPVTLRTIVTGERATKLGKQRLRTITTLLATETTPTAMASGSGDPWNAGGER